MSELLTCTECGKPDEDCVCAEAERDLLSCPYYQSMTKPDAERGTCTFGCREEPSCITCEPENGWPSTRTTAARSET